MSSIETVRERLRRLGAKAKASEEIARDDREARDQVIEEAEAQGLSVRQIAGDVGCSRPRVHQILTDRAAARQAKATRPV